MQKIYRLIPFVLIFALFLASASAQQGHLKLLAVSELENGSMHGGVADLYLEIRQGTGRIFLDTYPLSKFDTQLSIRFAKDISCKFADIDCSSYDFLYTIRAKSDMIGGPSAGAAVSVLTYSMLNNITLDENVAITGTINPGRLIGSVGAIKEKIEGAARSGIKKVLIPMDEVMKIDEDNITLNMTEYGNSLGIEVYGVNDIEEAIYYFSGKDLRKSVQEIKTDNQYLQIMKNISLVLCNRTSELISLINKEYYSVNSTYNGESLNKTLMDGIGMHKFANSIFSNNSFYSSASQCYGANIKLNFVYLISINETDKYYEKRIKALDEAISFYEDDIDKRGYDTISDLQTSMIIMQRIEEAKEYVANAKRFFLNTTNNESTLVEDRNSAIYNVALAIERLRTSALWAQFYSLQGPKYILNESVLQNSCNDILEEAKIRLQYARLYLPGTMQEQEEKMGLLKGSSDPEYCIAEASMIKADIDSLVSAFGLTQDDVENMVKRKLKKAAEVLSEETMKGRFPILGYSYYEYANSLLLKDPTAALIYSEYALELSNLDLYLKSEYKSTEIVYKRRMLISFSLNQALFTASLCMIFFILGSYAARSYFFKHYAKKKRSK